MLRVTYDTPDPDGAGPRRGVPQAVGLLVYACETGSFCESSGGPVSIISCDLPGATACFNVSVYVDGDASPDLWACNWWDRDNDGTREGYVDGEVSAVLVTTCSDGSGGTDPVERIEPFNLAMYGANCAPYNDVVSVP